MTKVELTPDLIAQRLDELRREVLRKRHELDELTEELEWWEAGRKFFGEDVNGRPKPPGQGALIEEKKPTLREAILQIMNERPTTTWPTERMILELDKRGWLPNGKNAEHITRSRLASMKKQGDLERVARGRYRLAPTDEEA